MLVSSIFGTLSRPYAREYSMIFTSSSVVLKSSRNDRQTTLASIKTKIELACIPWRTKNQFEARKHLIMTRAIVLAMKLAGLSADVEELKIVCGAGVTYSDGVISIASTAIQPRKRNIKQAKRAFKDFSAWKQDSLSDLTTKNFSEGWNILEKLVLICGTVYALCNGRGQDEILHKFESRTDASWYKHATLYQYLYNSDSMALSFDGLSDQSRKVHTCTHLVMVRAFQAFANQDVPALSQMYEQMRTMWNGYRADQPLDVAFQLDSVLTLPPSHALDRGALEAIARPSIRRTLKWPKLAEMERYSDSFLATDLDGLFETRVVNGKDTIRMVLPEVRCFSLGTVCAF